MATFGAGRVACRVQLALSGNYRDRQTVESINVQSLVVGAALDYAGRGEI
jgi:hypothetical protein